MTTHVLTPPKSSDITTVAEQFDDCGQQYDACVFGMWAFLVSEVMFFGGIFAVYLVYRREYGSAFASASRELDIYWGTINTFVLLTSSLTMALAVRAAHLNRRLQTAAGVLATACLGAVFLAVKGLEYAHKVDEGLAPLFGLPFRFEGPDAGGSRLFFGLYFAMTGIHAAHMVIGLGLLTFLFARVVRDPPNRAVPVELIGLYWHFVDVVWIFLFPLLYLIDRTQ